MCGGAGVIRQCGGRVSAADFRQSELGAQLAVRRDPVNTSVREHGDLTSSSEKSFTDKQVKPRIMHDVVTHQYNIPFNSIFLTQR